MFRSPFPQSVWWSRRRRRADSNRCIVPLDSLLLCGPTRSPELVTLPTREIVTRGEAA